MTDEARRFIDFHHQRLSGLVVEAVTQKLLRLEDKGPLSLLALKRWAGAPGRPGAMPTRTKPNPPASSKISAFSSPMPACDRRADRASSST